jgi:Uma2 family endonuclease
LAIKKERYRKFGVQEYWLVDPRSQTIEIYHLKNGDYNLVSLAEESGLVKSVVLAGLEVEVADIFS